MSDPATPIPFDPFAPDEDAEARADEQAEADVAAGRVVPHEEVVRWLESWGTPAELPRPRPK